MLFSPWSYVNVTLELYKMKGLCVSSMSSDSLDTLGSKPVRGVLAAIRLQSSFRVIVAVYSSSGVEVVEVGKKSTGKVNGNEGKTTNAHVTSRMR